MWQKKNVFTQILQRLYYLISTLALALSQVCHHPAVLSSDSKIWTKVCRGLKVNIQELIIAKQQEIISNSLKDYERSGPLIIQEISRIHPESVIPNFVQMLIETVNASDLKMSMNDYAVFLTPEGQVYDRTTIDNLKENNDTKNIKRENKAYSYKEQMEEIALRREIEEKKKREGKWQEPKLTPKQKEAFSIQLEKESIIKNRLKDLNAQLMPYLILLKARYGFFSHEMSIQTIFGHMYFNQKFQQPSMLVYILNC